jgi:hypothetical protein
MAPLIQVTLSDLRLEQVDRLSPLIRVIAASVSASRAIEDAAATR